MSSQWKRSNPRKLIKAVFSKVWNWYKVNLDHQKKYKSHWSNFVEYNSSHLAACGSSISASITWDTSKQLCCCLSWQLKDKWLTLKKGDITAEKPGSTKKIKVWCDWGMFKDTAPHCGGWHIQRQTTTGVNQRSEQRDFWTHPCIPSSGKKNSSDLHVFLNS